MIKKIIIIKLILLFFLTLFFYWGIYIPKDKADGEIFFIVKTGDSLSSIAKNLEKEEIIKADYFFILSGLLSNKGKSLKPGNYKLSSSMSVYEILEKIASAGGERIVIIEGWSLRDIAKHLEKNGYGSEEDFYRLAGKPPFFDGERLIEHQKSEIHFIKDQEELSLEGFLFPDTYLISPGTPMEDIISTFLLNFENKIDGEIEKMIAEKETTLFKTIIIASLLEKEVPSFKDKRIVAGIIEKRLEKGMRLQIDATVSYLTGKKSVQVPVTETKITSLYNTYFVKGLPLGPICNPGIESIRAALSPEETDYLYYLSKPNGETVFSKTFQDHVAAKNRYLK